MLRRECGGKGRSREQTERPLQSSKNYGKGGSKKRLASGYILKVELIGFTDGWEVGLRNKERGLKDSSTISGVSRGKGRS